jgi:hypothetical protein
MAAGTAVNRKKEVRFEATYHEGSGGAYYALPMKHSGLTESGATLYNVPFRDGIVRNPKTGSRVWVVCREAYALDRANLMFDTWDEADGKAYELAERERTSGQPLYAHLPGRLVGHLYEGEAH